MGSKLTVDRSQEWAVYRLLVPLPVTVDWKAGSQTLRYNPSEIPPFCDVNLHWGEETFRYFGVSRYRSLAHAEWALSRGLELRVKPPSAVATFFDRLVREGRAERVHGPYCHVNYTAFVHLEPLDAYWAWPGLQNRE